MSVTPEPDFRIYMKDAAKVFCPLGIRKEFNRYELDFRAFMRHGMMASEFLAVNDGNFRLIVEKTQARRAEEAANG